MAVVALVEDEADAREIIADGLRRRGHIVSTYRDAIDASAGIDATVEVVITDLVMPGADGLTLLRTLLDREHNATRIVITSFADKDRAVQALNLGANYLLEKPFSVPQLDQVVMRALRTRGDARSIDEIFSRQIATLAISERDRQLIVYVLKGLGNGDIAAQLHISEQAVKSALHTLYRKLGICSRGELFHLIFPI